MSPQIAEIYAAQIPKNERRVKAEQTSVEWPSNGADERYAMLLSGLVVAKAPQARTVVHATLQPSSRDTELKKELILNRTERVASRIEEIKFWHSQMAKKIGLWAASQSQVN